MGSLSSKTKTKTTPTVTEPMNSALFGSEGLTNKITDFVNTDPSQYVAPTSDLQTTAFQNAKNLGGWQTGLADAATAAKAAGALPAGAASTTTYDAPALAQAAMAGGVNIDAVKNAEASLSNYHSILDNGGPQRYMDPAIDAYVKAAMANFDQSYGENKAAMQADAAKTRAFGGSRYGVAEAEYANQGVLDRASLDASLRAKAYAEALQAAGADASLATSTDATNAGLKTNVSMANAGAANTRATNQASLTQQRSLADQAAKNSFAIQQAQMEAASRAANASATNQTSMFNVQQQEAAAQRALQAAGVQGQIANSQAGNAATDAALQGQLGEMQRAIAVAQANALPTQLGIASSLYGQIAPQAYIGQNSVTKSSPGILPMIMNAASQAAAAYAGGGFG